VSDLFTCALWSVADVPADHWTSAYMRLDIYVQYRVENNPCSSQQNGKYHGGKQKQRTVLLAATYCFWTEPARVSARMSTSWTSW
jgi:hypothetical protein